MPATRVDRWASSLADFLSGNVVDRMACGWLVFACMAGWLVVTDVSPFTLFFACMAGWLVVTDVYQPSPSARS